MAKFLLELLVPMTAQGLAFKNNLVRTMESDNNWYTSSKEDMSVQLYSYAGMYYLCVIFSFKIIIAKDFCFELPMDHIKIYIHFRS